jgi:hypothetical protein
MPAKFGSRYSGGRMPGVIVVAFGILTATLDTAGLILHPTGAERATTPVRSAAGSAPCATVTASCFCVSPAAKSTCWSSRPPTKSAAVTGLAPAPVVATRTEQATVRLPVRVITTA